MPAYWTAILIVFAVWFIPFSQKKFRFEMVIVGLILSPFVVVDYFTNYVYWHPETLGNIPVGLEAFIFTFFISGIASVIYNFTFSKKLINNKKLNLQKLIPFSIPLLLSCSIFLFTGINFMHLIIISFLLFALTIFVLRKDLIKNGLLSGLTFGVLYFIAFTVWIHLAPEASNWWNSYNLLGFIGVVPIDEILIGISFGAFVGPLYEFLIGKVKN